MYFNVQHRLQPVIVRRGFKFHGYLSFEFLSILFFYVLSKITFEEWGINRFTTLELIEQYFFM